MNKMDGLKICFVLLHLVVLAHAIWKCADKDGICQPSFDEIMKDANEPEGPEARKYSGLRQCKAGVEPQIIPGIDEFQYGYNIVNDKGTWDTAHTTILDCTSVDKFNATKQHPNNQTICYFVPDAFASQNIGVKFRSRSTNMFEAIGSESVNEHRQKSIESRSTELSVGGGFDLGKFGASAAFSSSDSTSTLEEFANKNSENKHSSSITYHLSSHELHIGTAIPTKKLVARWRDLAITPRNPTETDNAFREYFHELGTHYYLSAAVGGQMTILFTAKSDSKSESKTSAQQKANCVGAKVSVSFLKIFSVDTAYKACESSYSSDYRKAQIEHFVENHHIICEGGDQDKCPSDLNFEKAADQFEDWKKTVMSNPVLIGGKKRWIIQLLDDIIVNAEHLRNFEGDAYKEVASDFGHGNELKENVQLLKDFRGKMYGHLVKYLQDHDYCRHVKGGCYTVIGGKGLAVGGDWNKFEDCPDGMFIQTAIVFVDAGDCADTRAPKQKDCAGMTGLELSCAWPGLPRPGGAKFIYSGQFPDKGGKHGRHSAGTANCLGYLSAYSVQARGFVGAGGVEDALGMTSIKFKCVENGTVKEQNTHIAAYEGYGGLYWLDWVNCPDKYGLCGFQTLVKKYQGPLGDDTAYENIRFKCCYAETNQAGSDSPQRYD